IDLISDGKAARPRTSRGHHTGPVEPGHKRKPWLALGQPFAFSHAAIPDADARSVNIDEHLVRAGFRGRKRMQLQDAWWSELLDGSSMHFTWDSRQPSTSSSSRVASAASHGGTSPSAAASAQRSYFENSRFAPCRWSVRALEAA